MAKETTPRVIVLGGGFASFRFLYEFSAPGVQVTAVSPRNHFLFTPLLASTTVGTVEFRSIIEPLRLARRGIEFCQAYCVGLDTAAKRIQCQEVSKNESFDLPYDYLVIGVGAETNTYNIPGVKEHALFLKELTDARELRQKIITCLELAALPNRTPQERSRLLQFVVVGGGPTGVEFAAELHDFVRQDLARAYPSLVSEIKIILLEASKKILHAFDERLGQYTLRLFKTRQIEVRTDSLVSQVESERVILKDGSHIPFGVLVWSTGIGPTEFIQKSNLPKDSFDRVLTDELLRVKELTEVYAIGDCATIEHLTLPATGQLAMQQGKYLARALQRTFVGKSITPFRYKHLGMLAYVGGTRAIADLPGVKGSGIIAWLLWRSIYLTKLVSLKNKTRVLFDWIKAALFGRDITTF